MYVMHYKCVYINPKLVADINERRDKTEGLTLLPALGEQLKLKNHYKFSHI